MATASPARAPLDEVFRAHERHLWALCYRMTGSAADAEDLVQETFERALTRPPKHTDRPWRPWLVRVAMNLSRDHLRRRRRRGYTGPWLPAPIETEALELEPAHEPGDTAGRYELMESVSFAFLIALEALTPAQRAVLLLRDVLDYSAHEAGDALDMSDANVRTTLHRARRAMAAYDQARCVPGPELRAQTQELVGRFLGHLATGDVPALEEMLARDVVAINDSDGKYSAARVPVRGANKVARFHVGIQRLDAGLRFAVREINGLPAVVGELEKPYRRNPPRFVWIAIPDADGRFVSLHTIVAPEKLSGITPVQPGLGALSAG